MAEMKIRGPLPSPDCAHNSRAHYMAKARAVATLRDQTGWAARSMAQSVSWRGTKPVEIDIVYACFRGCLGYQPRDVMNAMDAIKAGIDGLVDAGVMPDDTRRFLRIGSIDLKTTMAECMKLGGAGVYYTVRQQ